MFRVRTRLRAGFAGGGGGVIPPVNSVAPAITGNAYVGSTLTCSTGTWLNNPLTYSYQWKRGVTNVGTDQNTYAPVTGDIGSTITCTVTATNSAGSASQVSNTTAAVIGTPVNTVAPAITGNAYVGSTLTSSTGTWTGGSLTYSYQWVRNPSTNVGTNQNTYVPVTGDLGSTIRCVVTATNASGADQANSNNTAAVIAVPANTVIPAISGTASVGSTLTSTTGTWTGGGSITYSYQWKSAGSNVGADQNTYVPVTGDVGNTITVTVTATNAAGTGTPAVSNATSAVIVTDPNWTSVVLLLPFDGVDGATATSDLSNSAHTMSFFGQAQLDTAQQKFGTASLLLDGTGDAVTTPDSADWAFGAAAFTVEGFIRPASVTGVHTVVCQWKASANQSWYLYTNGASLVWQVSTTGANTFVDMSAGTVSINTWQYVCVDFDGSKYRMYLGTTGTASMIASFSTPRTLFNATANCAVGADSDNTQFYFNGWIDEVRVTKGVARYASDAGATIPTTAFPTS